MSGATNDLKSLAEEVRRRAVLPWPVRTMSLADPAGLMHLSQGWTSQPSYLVPPKAPQQPLRDLIRSKFPPPAPGGKSVGDVVIQCATATAGPGLAAAMYEVEKLPWPDRFKVFDALQADSALDNMTSLEALESALGAAQLPDVNPALHPAMIAVLLQTTRRTINNASIAANFTLAFLDLTVVDQIAILGRLGLHGMAAEGTIAQMTGEAIEAGIMTVPQQLLDIAEQAGITEVPHMGVQPQQVAGFPWKVPMGEWKPNGMPEAFYIGVSAHIEIAENYRLENLPDLLIWTNSTSVDSILLKMEQEFVELADEGYEVEAALGLSRPDIFHFNLAHPYGAPGWVYEIKPHTTPVAAEMEALFYADALTLAGIQTTPGPMGTPGTKGCVPAPDGWFVFMCVAPGAIIYWYKKATKEQRKAAGREPADETAKQRVQSVLQGVGLNPNVAAAAAAVLLIIIAAGEKAGWVLLVAA